MCSAAPGTPKKLGWEPMASTRWSPLKDWPSALVTVLVAGSTATISQCLTVTVGALRNMARRGRRTSVGASCAVADLVQQGLELVVVVSVDQGHGDTGIAQDLERSRPPRTPRRRSRLAARRGHRRRPYLRPHQPAHPSWAIRFTVGRCHDAGAPLNRADPNANQDEGREPGTPRHRHRGGAGCGQPRSWARAQMAFTLAFHIILVPLGVSWAFNHARRQLTAVPRARRWPRRCCWPSAGRSTWR